MKNKENINNKWILNKQSLQHVFSDWKSYQYFICSVYKYVWLIWLFHYFQGLVEFPEMEMPPPCWESRECGAAPE